MAGTMERAYLTFSVSAPVRSEGITFQYLTANSEDGAERMRAGIRTVRERHGFPIFRVLAHGLAGAPGSEVREGGVDEAAFGGGQSGNLGPGVSTDEEGDLPSLEG
jgi:hypothetical protein